MKHIIATTPAPGLGDMVIRGDHHVIIGVFIINIRPLVRLIARVIL